MNEATMKARLDALHYAGLHVQEMRSAEEILERAEKYFVFLTLPSKRPSDDSDGAR
ncbi:hypothetical protein LCGC14_1782760 [marine sediment metagenome]|uniref:Uncharacterized protein n=1 Tax=marine sediment metagenome TaxID=412755 RepID=A0A0F9GUU2_9ZZZZ